MAKAENGLGLGDDLDPDVGLKQKNDFSVVDLSSAVIFVHSVYIVKQGVSVYFCEPQTSSFLGQTSILAF